MRLIRHDDSDHPYYQALINGIVGYNSDQSFPEKWYGIAFYLEDEAGQFLGGLQAEVQYDYVFIQRLWVACQEKGHGSALLDALEKTAREMGKKGVFLDTFAFQACDFYIKQGYKQFGEIEEAAGAHSRYFMIKTFSS